MKKEEEEQEGGGDVMMKATPEEAESNYVRIRNSLISLLSQNNPLGPDVSETSL